MSRSDGVSRRTLLLGLGGASAVGFGSGVGTRAALFDRETVADNRLRAGSLDLELATRWFRGRRGGRRRREWTALDEETGTWGPVAASDAVEFPESAFSSNRTVDPAVTELGEGDVGAVLTGVRVCDGPAAVGVRLDGDATDGETSGEDLVDRVRGLLFSADALGSVGWCADPDRDRPSARVLDTGSLRELLGRSYDLGPATAGGVGCLSACEPEYVGFVWWFPRGSEDDRGWVGDAVDFSLTFDAVQCRHREEGGGSA